MKVSRWKFVVYSCSECGTSAVARRVEQLLNEGKEIIAVYVEGKTTHILYSERKLEEV